MEDSIYGHSKSMLFLSNIRMQTFSPFLPLEGIRTTSFNETYLSFPKLKEKQLRLIVFEVMSLFPVSTSASFA